jgi:LacI family transcriptional regulator
MDADQDDTQPAVTGGERRMLQSVNHYPHPRGPDLLDICRAGGALRTDAPRVLALLNMSTAWSRGVLRGLTAFAHERRWTILHYPPPVDIAGLLQKFQPAAVVLGPDSHRASVARIAPVPVVSVGIDLSSDGIASVCPDEEGIAALALQHLFATGLRQVSTFRFDDSPFAVSRERAFVEGARKAGVKVSEGARLATGWGCDEAGNIRRTEDPELMMAWLSNLPKPCGIFTCTDHWARIVARYIHLAGLRMPEELALVGVDNDVTECELLAPPLSSVVVNWQELGRSAAKLVEQVLSGHSIHGQHVSIPPVAVMARRSSDVLAIDDVLVAKAVRWIREHADQRLTVPMVAHAIGGGRQRLERRFRRALDRTVQEEIRRAHVEAAKGLLRSTRASMAEIASRSGFTNAALLSVAFKREVGMPPGVYRRRVRQALVSASDD